MDINGDGMSDVVQHYYVDDAGGTNPHVAQTWLNLSGKPDLLEAITYSSGAQTAVAYSPLARNDAGCYLRGNRGSVSYPLNDVQDTRYVVRRVTEDDGIGGVYHVNYSYTALRKNLL